MTKSAIVVGPNSMLGSRLIELLLGNGYKVHTCGRSPNCDVKMELGSESNFKLSSHVSADILFHCAASFEPDTLEGAWKNEKTNALAGYQITQLATAAGCKSVVYSGSIFSDSPSGRKQLNSYGASKARGEEIMQWGLSKSSISFCSLRFPQIYDELGFCLRHQPWFCRIIAYAAHGRQLRLPPGDALRNFLHVLDATKMMIIAGEMHCDGIFPASHPESPSHLTVASMAYSIFQNGGTIEIATGKPPFRDIYIPDSGHTFNHLRFSPEITLKTGIELIKRGGNGTSFSPLDVN